MKYGLIGEKLGHSFSKEIHEKIADYTYELKEIKKEDLENFILSKEFSALNVTIPYKEMVIPYMDFIDEKALEIKAVNTIVNKDGKLFAYNTDYYGLKALILNNNIDCNNKTVLILGTGGTSKTASVVLKDLNAKKVLFVSRSNKDDKPNVITYNDAKDIEDVNIIINTTPNGMYPKDEEPIIDIANYKALEAVVDVVYNPLKTRLVRDALELGVIAVGGLYMLVGQAVYAVERFLDMSFDDITKVIDRVYKDILSKKENIVLIGMPGCGKSTIGKMLSEKLNKELIDSDVEIEKVINCQIKDFLTESNEEEFRDIESSVINNISLLNNKIISTGGGAVKRSSNVKSLKGNGIIVFIDRSIDNIKTDDTRPLSSNVEKLNKLHKERYPLYKNACDYEVSNNGDIHDTVNKIIELINFKGE